MMSEIPVLETPRLRLRGHTLADLEACTAMWGDPDTTKHIGGRPFTAEESWARVLRYAGHWALLGYGFWAIEEKASGTYIGDTGIADFKREIESPLSGCPEVGWAIVASARGKGYATEAMQAVTAWGDVRFKGATTVCIIDLDNQPSMRVAEKSGYCRVGTVDYKGNPIMLFSRVPVVAKAAVSPAARR